MNQDDRYHTTSWDGDEVVRRAEETERSVSRADGGQSAPRPAGQQKPKKKKRKRRRTNPLLAILLWVVIVAATSSICAAVGWMLANDFAALNKPMKEVSFQITEDYIAEVAQEEQEDGSVKEVTYYDMAKVTAALKEEGLIETTGSSASSASSTMQTGRSPRAHSP